jgi:hypothetical protein
MIANCRFVIHHETRIFDGELIENRQSEIGNVLVDLARFERALDLRRVAL